MSFDPFEKVTLGTTSVEVTRLGLGTAEIGGLYTAVPEEQAAGLIAHAWDIGVRYFDTAPLYGYGTAERRTGNGLRARPRDEFSLSTKVGRLVVPLDEDPSGAGVEGTLKPWEEDGFFGDIPPARVEYDYSRDGVLRSVEESLGRLGLDRIDILYIHDADFHFEDAIGGAYPALHELREQGVIGAIGAGMNQVEMTARFAREGDFDAFMLAGRYTLLEQPALAELLPLCVEKDISIVAVGVMNSGILADPNAGARYNYTEAPTELIERAQRMAAVCERHGTSLKTAAIQFPLAHPAVASVAAGVRTIEHLDDYPAAMAADVPAQLWQELKAEGLLSDSAPTP
jgi:D-threo-aldose 1-dehydrogenase